MRASNEDKGQVTIQQLLRGPRILSMVFRSTAVLDFPLPCFPSCVMYLRRILNVSCNKQQRCSLKVYKILPDYKIQPSIWSSCVFVK